ncbi:hypothetical protein F5882DRAFT_295929 [Hyaloscypha sp. PMI_1271]|nr:hypothetical protein F5882DRAFT_295929 [Hyaloscypha sp. PMI_1271]
MVFFTSIFTCLAILSTTVVALTIPLGTTGQSLSISEDGQTISIDGRAISLGQAVTRAGACNPSSQGGGRQRHGKGGASSNSTSAASNNAKAIYFLSNAANNSIVALKVAADGTLSDGSITSTGGAGMSGVDSTGAPAAPDSLFSQGALKVAGNSLVAVNPGSNTLSMFSISPTDPTQLTPLGSPVSTLGDFPVSVTLSTKLSLACVANTGARAGLACLTMSSNGLTPLDKTLRPFALNQSNPPSGPLNTVSQTFFNADSSALLTTVKGDPSVNNTGFLSVFPVTNGTVSMTETRSSPAGTAVLFGTALLPNSNNIFVTDASFGSATLSLDAKNVASVRAKTNIADQKATCWAAFSDVTGTAFVTDVAVNHLVEVDTATGALIKELQSGNGNPGMIDLVSVGNFVYALSPGIGSVKAAVTVFDISGGRGGKLWFILRGR